jgi:hypothetical protein
MRKQISVVVALLVFLLVVSCEKGEDNMPLGSSHNAGRNCLSCHSTLKLAGTAYNKALTGAFAGAIIKVTSQANGQGTLLASLSSDNSGNFYTGASINFGTGVFVSAEGTGGTVKYMSSAITSGACNSCHGSSTSKIWAE